MLKWSRRIARSMRWARVCLTIRRLSKINHLVTIRKYLSLAWLQWSTGATRKFLTSSRVKVWGDRRRGQWWIGAYRAHWRMWEWRGEWRGGWIFGLTGGWSEGYTRWPCWLTGQCESRWHWRSWGSRVRRNRILQWWLKWLTFRWWATGVQRTGQLAENPRSSGRCELCRYRWCWSVSLSY